MRTIHTADGETVTLGDNIHRCIGCRVWLPESAYYADRSRSAGVSSRCRKCAQACRKEYRDAVAAPAQRLVKQLKVLAETSPTLARKLEAEFSNHAHAG